MTSKIGGSVGGGNWKYAHGTAHFGRNFSVKWLKVSSTTTSRPLLRNFWVCSIMVHLMHAVVFPINDDYSHLIGGF